MKNSFESPETGGGKAANRLSRREFLKRAGGAAAFGLLPLGAGFFTETPRAWSKEVKDGDSWIEGIEAMRDDVFYSETESLALYVVAQDQTGSWKSYISGTPIRLSAEVLEKEIKKSPKKIQIVHSHPLITFQEFGLTQAQIKNLQNGEGLAPSMPPSIEDIRGTMQSQSVGATENKNVEIISMAIDPRGLWEFSVDLKHDFARMIVIFNEWGNILNRYPLIRHMVEHNIPLPQELPKGISAFMPKVEEASRAYKEVWQKELENLHKAINAYTENSFKERGIDETVLIENFKKLGLTVSFTTFEDIRKKSGVQQ